jgi:4-alpha-glucanotransferase
MIADPQRPQMCMPGWLDSRSMGVLAHVSSLPGEYGIGNLGAGARRFLDFLGRAGVRYWQVCPLGPTGYGDSPYQSFSSRAGNPYFIDLGELISAELLMADDVSSLRKLPESQVDYGELYHNFWRVLAVAYDRFAAARADALPGLGSFAAFRRRHEAWLEPFADFMGLKAQFGGRPWTEGPEPFRTWRPGVRTVLSPLALREADRHAFYQYVFFGQWERLRRYAAERRIGIIGDVPIFVSLDSADAWRNPAIFRLDEAGRPLAVAGVPPDYFSAAGQLWGNPLYNWERLAATDFDWWIDRLRAAFNLCDVVRLDHFRGFETYWEIPAGAPDARRGAWRKGPGLAFFEAVRRRIPEARIIAEDLGYITAEVVALRREAGLPGMKVLQFAYGHDRNNVNLPHFCTPDSVAYTGTHDNLTTRGWLERLAPGQAAEVDAYFGLDGSRSAWPMIRAALATASRLVVIPLQDLLDLPAEATLNRPGTAEGNWQWRFTPAQLERLEHDREATLRKWIRVYDRAGERPVRDFSEPPDDAAHP